MNPRLKLAYFLVLDASYSMESKWESLSSSLMNHLDRLLHWRDQQEGVVMEVSLSSFNQELSFHPLNRNIDQVKNLLESTTVDGQSALYDALGSVLQQVQSGTPTQQEETTYKLLCFFTDGQDNCSSQFDVRQINEQLKRLNQDILPASRFKGIILGVLPQGLIGMECLDLDESSVAFSEELTLSFRYLENLMAKWVNKQ
jgi:hypothetical protein